MTCDDLRTENDEFRLTVADLSQRLDDSTKKNDAYGTFYRLVFTFLFKKTFL